MDARNEEQCNRVRIFQQEQLSKPECTEKWDRIKIVCTQPFNKFLKYGLAFITLHQPQAVAESAAPSLLGRFTVKNDNDDISVGSIFARRKEQCEPDPEPLSAGKLPLPSAPGIEGPITGFLRAVVKKNVIWGPFDSFIPF